MKEYDAATTQSYVLLKYLLYYFNITNYHSNDIRQKLVLTLFDAGIGNELENYLDDHKT